MTDANVMYDIMDNFDITILDNINDNELNVVEFSKFCKKIGIKLIHITDTDQLQDLIKEIMDRIKICSIDTKIIKQAFEPTIVFVDTYVMSKTLNKILFTYAIDNGMNIHFMLYKHKTYWKANPHARKITVYLSTTTNLHEKEVRFE